jgi:hypothetical protein
LALDVYLLGCPWLPPPSAEPIWAGQSRRSDTDSPGGSFRTTLEKFREGSKTVTCSAYSKKIGWGKGAVHVPEGPPWVLAQKPEWKMSTYKQVNKG